MSIEGFGAKFEYADTTADFTTATGWTEVGEVTELTPPETEVDDIETTHHRQTSHAKTFVGGLYDGGEAEVGAHYSKTVYATLSGLKRVAKKFRILFSDGSGVGWSGYVKKVGTAIDLEGLTSMTVATKVSGDPVEIAAVGGGA